MRGAIELLDNIFNSTENYCAASQCSPSFKIQTVNNKHHITMLIHRTINKEHIHVFCETSSKRLALISQFCLPLRAQRFFNRFL